MKKLLAMVLALVMTLSLAVSANAAFEDAKDINATYAEAVDVLAGMKVFQGYDNGKTFKPQGDITRAEVAAIVYRIYTADVKDSYVKNYETYNKFSDMAGAGWAKGYIGYCANAALVKGYPNGTFLPSGKVTGYEVLAMILRAVGYDKNNEFTGADWALHVAQIAEQNKILKNVKGIDLSAPASRELVAELLFQAIQVPTVTYTAAFGYQDVSLTADKKTDKLVKANSSLGYKNFKLISGNDSDDWGRPVTVWAKDANDNGEYDVKKDTTVYATIVATPDAAFHVATTECDICEALGIKKTDKIVEIYDNGKLTKDTDTLTATETKDTLGAQGQQIEFYEVDGGYRLVVIDTYLAKVNDVVTEKVDSKNHVTRDDYLEIRVFDAETKTEANYTTQYVAGNDYAEGDYILVNVNKSATTKIILTNNASASVKPLVEVVGKADSFEGAQSEIWYNANKHTIDKTEYNDAEMFLLNMAGKKGTDKYTWFVDQYGNLIGCTSIDSTNYAVLKDIIWKSGTKAHAEATLVYMDGTETTAEVKSIDGLDSNNGLVGGFEKTLDDAITAQGDTVRDVEIKVVGGEKLAKVSTSDIYNDGYQGLALYKVETDKDGKVSLQAITTKANGNVKDTYVAYAEDVTINPDSTVLKIKKVESQKVSYTKVTLSDNTQFLVREKDDNGDFVYSTYTLKDLPKYADDSLTVYYTVGDNGFVTRVYIKNATDESAFGKFVYMPEKNISNFKWIVDSSYDKGGYYKAQVYVDGELQWVQVNEETGKLLNDNVGKLYKATKWNKSTDSDYFGQLKQVELVTEANDSEWASNKVVADYVYSGTLDGKVLESRDSNGNVENSWWIGDAKVISVDGKTTELTKDVLKTQSVWVVSKETKREGVADYIFIGDKLGDVASDAAKALKGTDLGDIVLTDATLDTMKAAAVKKAESILNDKGITGITVEVSYTAKDNENVNFVPNLGTEETIWFQFTLTDSADSSDSAGSCKADVTNNYSKDSLEAAIKDTLEKMTEIKDGMTTAAAKAEVEKKLANYDLDDLTVEVEGKLEAKNQVTVTVTGTDADLGAVSASAKVVVANA